MHAFFPFSIAARTVAILAVISVLINATHLYLLKPQQMIRVGVLHSRTGTLSLSELPVANATLMAIQEINKRGGLLGRPLEAVIVDGKSDVEIFAREAEKLITEDKVDVVFGCWSSASRKTVKPIFERYDRLLFYPVEYEGLEESPDIVYTGAVPNQQALPATIWAMQQFGKRIFLVGSDYVFPRAVNEVVKEFTTRLGAEIVGEEYFTLGAELTADVVKKIIASKADFVLNSINGSTNIPFFQDLTMQTTAHPIPVMSLSVDDALTHAIGIAALAGNYTSWNYYESIAGPINAQFVQHLKNTYGRNQVVTDPMEAAYIGVHLWAEAVQRAGTTNSKAVLNSLKETAIKAPEGFVSVDTANHHLHKTVRIAQITPDGASRIIWLSRLPVGPEPYPNDLFIASQLSGLRTTADWNSYLKDLYTNWGNQWQSP